MPRSTRRRRTISVGFSSGGRANLINSLTPTQSELDAKKAEVRANDTLMANKYRRGDITYDQYESYLNGRIAEETDATYKAQLSDELTTAKLVDQQATDSKKIAAYNNGTLSYEDMLAYLQDRAAHSLNTKDQQNIADAITSLKLNKQKQDDAMWDNKWKSGAVTGAQYLAYLQGRQTSATTDADRAAVGLTIKAVQTKNRQDADSAKLADFQANRISAQEYAKYLQSQAASKDITPQEAQNYTDGAKVVIDNWNKQQDSANYYAYAAGKITYEQAKAYFDHRMETAPQDQQDDLLKWQTELQNKQLDSANGNGTFQPKPAGSGTGSLTSQVTDVINDAKNLLDQRIEAAKGIDDPGQRQAYLLAAYEMYDHALQWGSQQNVQNGGVGGFYQLESKALGLQYDPKTGRAIGVNPASVAGQKIASLVGDDFLKQVFDQADAQMKGLTGSALADGINRAMAMLHAAGQSMSLTSAQQRTLQNKLNELGNQADQGLTNSKTELDNNNANLDAFLGDMFRTLKDAGYTGTYKDWRDAVMADSSAAFNLFDQTTKAAAAANAATPAGKPLPFPEYKGDSNPSYNTFAGNLHKNLTAIEGASATTQKFQVGSNFRLLGGNPTNTGITKMADFRAGEHVTPPPPTNTGITTSPYSVFRQGEHQQGTTTPPPAVTGTPPPVARPVNDVAPVNTGAAPTNPVSTLLNFAPFTSPFDGNPFNTQTFQTNQQAQHDYMFQAGQQLVEQHPAQQNSPAEGVPDFKPPSWQDYASLFGGPTGDFSQGYAGDTTGDTHGH